MQPLTHRERSFINPSFPFYPCRDEAALFLFDKGQRLLHGVYSPLEVCRNLDTEAFVHGPGLETALPAQVQPPCHIEECPL